MKENPAMFDCWRVHGCFVPIAMSAASDSRHPHLCRDIGAKEVGMCSPPMEALHYCCLHPNYRA